MQAGFDDTRVQDRVRELFKLNTRILDAMLHSMHDSGIKELEGVFAKPGEADGAQEFVRVVGWRGTFINLAAGTAAALHQIPRQVVALEPLMDDET